MRHPLRAFLCLVVAFGLLASSASAAIASPAPAASALDRLAITPATYSPDQQECAFLGIINDYRADNDLGPLTITRTLGAAAEYHSLDMVEHDYFSHTLDDGTTWEENILDFNYPAVSSRAENLAAGYSDAANAFVQWKNSPGHNRNMLSSKYNAIGIGRAQGATYGWYWTTTFGSVIDTAYYCDGRNPAIDLSKTSGKYNGRVEVEASGFSSNSAVTLRWDGVALETGITDGDGDASLQFNVPLAVFGYHDVTVRDATGKTAETRYRVIPRILLNEPSGPTDTRLRVYFYGFASGERVEVRWHESESRYSVLTTLTIADNGRGSSLIEIPESTSSGAHKIVGKVIGVSRSASTTFTVTGVVKPEMDLSKSSGKYNGLVGVNATGFNANSSLTLSWDGTEIGSATTNGAGEAALSFRVPLAEFGNHTVTLRDSQGRSDSATYRVIPRILLNETSGSTDTRLRVYFYGFAAGERVQVRWHATNSTGSSYEVLTTITVANNGRASSLIEIPDGASARSHRIVGKVIGVSRSASTTFVVTEVRAADVETDESTATPEATPTTEPTVEATPEVTESPAGTATPEPTETPAPEPTETVSPQPAVTETATATATPSETPEPVETPIPTPTETDEETDLESV